MDVLAALDQIRAEMRGCAQSTAVYHDALVQTGSFTDEQAFQLTRDWHLNYWQTLHMADGDSAAHAAGSPDD